MARKSKIKKKINNFFSIHGINSCLILLQSKKYAIVNIDIMKGGKAEKSRKIFNLIDSRKLKLSILKKEIFTKKYIGLRTQGIVINFIFNFNKNHTNSISEYKKSQCYIALDSIQDPQNIGQIIRTAYCAGIDGIIIPRNKGNSITNSILQVSQGAFVDFPLFVCNNLKKTILDLKNKNFDIVAIENSINAKKWYEIDYSNNVILVLGSEGFGISSPILHCCNQLSTIPMKNKVNSLNVSAATSAILFERKRQIES